VERGKSKRDRRNRAREKVEKGKERNKGYFGRKEDLPIQYSTII